jgi:uncharacterized protein YwqG
MAVIKMLGAILKKLKMFEEVLLFDDEINQPKYWIFIPIGDKNNPDSYQLEYGEIGQPPHIEIFNLNKKNRELEWEIHEIISKKIKEGYRKTYKNYLIPENYEKIRKIQLILKKNGFAKKAWIPQSEKKEGSLIQSKIGGKPFLFSEEKYPTCNICGKLMQLMFQVNFEEVPDEMRIIDKGLFQFFFCTNLDNDKPCYISLSEKEIKEFMNEKMNEKGKYFLLRILNNFEKNVSDYKLPENDYLLKENIIKWKFAGFEYSKEYYMMTEIPELKNFIITDYQNIKEQIKGIEIEYGFIQGNNLENIEGEKLGGYPVQCQNNPISICPECKKQGEHFIQIGSDINFPFEWGDGGYGHIFICKEHKRMGLTWDCC